MVKRALVTGAAGFVGAALTRRLLNDGHEVHALVRPESDLWRLEGVDVPIEKADLADGAAVSAVVRRTKPEWIFHLAAHGAYPSQLDFRAMVLANVLGTFLLVKSCLAVGFETMVHTGSSSEYGFCDHAPPEAEEPRPRSSYAATKLSSTMYCRAAALKNRVAIPTLRLYSAYGPFEEPTRFVPALAVQGIEGKLPPLVAPEVARDFIYVDDAVEAYIVAASSRHDEDFGAVYNVGTGRQTSIADIVEIVRRVLSIEALPRWGTMPNRSWDTTLWVSNPTKIQKALGWSARVSFEEGFPRFVDWLREDPARLTLYRERSARSRL